jgi:hypothetical protein
LRGLKKIASPGDADLLPDLDTDRAFEHLGVLLLVPVCINWRGEGARLDLMLDEREGAPGIYSVHHKSYAEPIKP